MTKLQKIVLITIIIFGALSRFLWLNNFPPSLNWDEVSHGYTAYSLLLTGKDQWGVSWPIFNTRAYGDYPTMLNIYLTIPFVKLFGLNPVTTRIPSALAGFLLIPLTFILTKSLFKNTNQALVASFLVLITPWTFFTSRAVFQSTIAQVFVVAGLYFLLSKHKNIYFLPLSALTLGISMYAYHNARIFIPLFFVIYLILERQKLKITKTNLIALLIFLAFLIPQGFDLINPSAQARSRWVFLLNPASINYINNQRGQIANPILGKIMYNKVTYTLTSVTLNYLNFLNPIPLFFKGTGNYQFNIPNQGLLFIITLPFFYLGLIWTIKNYQKPNHLFLISWFFLAMFPAALTYGDFPSIRLMTILPLPLIFTTIGLFLVIKYLRSKNIQTVFISLFLILVSLDAIQYFQNYFTQYFTNYSPSWQYGYQPMVQYLKKHYTQYNHFYITKKYGEPHEFILYYWPWNPKSYQNDPNLIWNYHADWYWVDAFDKFIFLNDWEIINPKTPFLAKSLLITSPGNYPKSATKIDTINYPNKTPAFDIVKL